MKKLIKNFLIVLLLAAVSGCAAENSDSLLAVPKFSGDYLALQSSIDEIKKSGAIQEYPTSGQNRNAVQLADIDGDGVDEAVSFFRDSVGSGNFTVYIHKKTDGEYKVVGNMCGQGTEIEYVLYPVSKDMGARSVVVCFNRGTYINGIMDIGCFDNDGIFSERLSAEYSYVLLNNFDEDGKEEIVAIYKNGISGQFASKIYNFSDDGIDSSPEIQLSAGIRSIACTNCGTTEDGLSAVFIDGVSSGKGYITDIIAGKNGKFVNLPLDNTSGISFSTYRQVSIPSSNMLGDYRWHIPLAYPMPGYSDFDTSPQWLLEWNSVDENGILTPFLYTYHNISERWYFIMPDDWKGKVTVKQESREDNFAKTVFSEYIDGHNDVPLFSLYAIDNEYQWSFSEISGYITIGKSPVTTYYIHLEEGGRESPYFLSEEDIRANFRIISKIWMAEELGK